MGYFDFSGVTIAAGAFSGYAYNDNTGWLKMDGVTTTWQPAVATPSISSSGSVARRRAQALQTSPVKSATADHVASLQSQLATLQAQLAVLLQAQPSGLPTLPTVKFTRNLASGLQGSDVKALQQYLNARGFFLAATGLGSSGQETTLFGALTRQALARFQKANNISPPVGFFGPLTREFINNQ